MWQSINDGLFVFSSSALHHQQGQWEHGFLCHSLSVTVYESFINCETVTMIFTEQEAQESQDLQDNQDHQAPGGYQVCLGKMWVLLSLTFWNAVSHISWI
jgi:hypothetical protein